MLRKVAPSVDARVHNAPATDNNEEATARRLPPPLLLPEWPPLLRGMGGNAGASNDQLLGGLRHGQRESHGARRREQSGHRFGSLVLRLCLVESLKRGRESQESLKRESQERVSRERVSQERERERESQERVSRES